MFTSSLFSDEAFITWFYTQITDPDPGDDIFDAISAVKHHIHVLVTHSDELIRSYCDKWLREESTDSPNEEFYYTEYDYNNYTFKLYISVNIETSVFTFYSLINNSVLPGYKIKL